MIYSPVVLWVVGEPGVGKTSMVRELLGTSTTFAVDRCSKWTISDDVAAAGIYRGDPFDGGDTVPYNGALKTVEYWQQHFSNKSLTILDGDRFSTRAVKRFFEQTSSKPALWCLLLTSSYAAERRAQRSQVTGAVQSSSWVKGRRTKSYNFWNKFPGQTQYMLDTDHLTPALSAGWVRTWLSRNAPTAIPA